MKPVTLERLLRLEERALDQERHALAALEADYTILLRAREEGRAGLLGAFREAGRGEHLSLYGELVEGGRRRVRDVEAAMARKAAVIEAQRERVREHMVARKRYEVLLNRRLRDEERESARREQARLDDIAAVRLARSLGGLAKSSVSGGDGTHRREG